MRFNVVLNSHPCDNLDDYSRRYRSYNDFLDDEGSILQSVDRLHLQFHDFADVINK